MHQALRGWRDRGRHSHRCNHESARSCKTPVRWLTAGWAVKERSVPIKSSLVYGCRLLFTLGGCQARGCRQLPARPPFLTGLISSVF